MPPPISYPHAIRVSVCSNSPFVCVLEFTLHWSSRQILNQAIRPLACNYDGIYFAYAYTANLWYGWIGFGYTCPGPPIVYSSLEWIPVQYHMHPQTSVSYLHNISSLTCCGMIEGTPARLKPLASSWLRMGDSITWPLNHTCTRMNWIIHECILQLGGKLPATQKMRVFVRRKRERTHACSAHPVCVPKMCIYSRGSSSSVVVEYVSVRII